MNEIVPLDPSDKGIIDTLRVIYDIDCINKYPGAMISDFLLWGEKPQIWGKRGDKRGTFHEWLFSLLFGNLKRQVPFGTGKNGMKNWFCKCYVADFVDEDRKIIYEIDGKSHNRKYIKARDRLRDYFFYEKGYRTIRFTNLEVENLFLDMRGDIFGRQSNASKS